MSRDGGLSLLSRVFQHRVCVFGRHLSQLTVASYMVLLTLARGYFVRRPCD